MKAFARLIPYRRRALDAEAANERLVKILSNPMIEGIEIGRGSLQIHSSGGAAGLLAGMLTGILDEPEMGGPSAKNYVEVSFYSQKHGSILVTVQKQSGKTPSQLQREAEKQRDEALRMLDVAEAKQAK